MIDRIKLHFSAQIISAMEEAILKLEKAYRKKDVENLEKSKKVILEFQEKLSAELENG